MPRETRTIANRDASAATDGNGAGCPWLPTALEQLAAIRRLPAGWDSDGAQPPEIRIVDDAERFLNRLCQEAPGAAAPHVHPTRSGGVQFEWELSNRYLEIEVAADGITYFFQDESAGIEESGTIQEAGDLKELVSYLGKVQSSK